MDRTFDMILTIAALVVGVMMVTGHGELFMKGGNAELRKKIYDEKKMEKSGGIAMILLGIATGINMYTEGFTAKIIYIIVLVVIFGGLIYYLRTKCRK